MRSTLRTPGRPRRRLMTMATALTVGSLALAGCGQAENAAENTGDDATPAAGGDCEEAELRYSWWGSDVRHQLNQEVIDAFEAENPGITITPDFTDWAGYWDKLATGVAGGDTPDILMQEERYLREYAERGVLADLGQYDIATDAIDDNILAAGETDGGLYGIPTGVNVYSVLANPQVFEQAGVEMPDDTTWSWEDFQEVAIQIGQTEGLYGMQDHGYNEPGFMIFARQKGEELYTPEGELGYEDETLVEWWEIALNLQRNGGQPAASETVEIQGLGPEQSLLGTNRGAMGAWWSNQLTAIETAAGTELELLRWPGSPRASGRACTSSPRCTSRWPPRASAPTRPRRSSTSCSTARRPVGSCSPTAVCRPTPTSARRSRATSARASRRRPSSSPTSRTRSSTAPPSRRSAPVRSRRSSTATTTRCSSSG
ncbi:extracellular solute-binding protein [Cellulomonas sp. ATA003]|uniref:ABC transporter substrate-binding protein n=1 Tax=Cellulomonas sp. ATA003 TaxID=3073064 RepID=UPI002872DA61|nr:extracellular solute-binding protein [Cellulomonas sp. ATA003]WNB86627.1 extracellular solute-binding protein [Cellulomonas sp. ATA003]